MQRPELIVNFRTLENNLGIIKSRLPEKVKVMGVVKDNAYGHGLLPVSSYLDDKVDGLCVARLDEAIALREGGIKSPVLVFEIPVKETAGDYLKYNLTAVIADLSVFSILKDQTRAHLQFDTGMHRLGIKPGEVTWAVELYKAHRGRLNITGIYTHFANADRPSNPMTAEQLRTFSGIRSKFPEELFTHTANSGAVLYHQDKKLHFDGVRCGISLYGYAPGATEIEGLKPVMELYAPIVQVKEVSKGDSVGYGSSWHAPEDGWLGILPVGYAHGIPRLLSNRISVEIDGSIYPQRGTISMDYMTVFLKDSGIEPGSVARIYGAGANTAKTWADEIGTIPYEIVTGMAPFIKRTYKKD